MRLKRLELAGFKSFVDPTRIELGDGITAIVGPNGCGKSNIVDAIRWVLGEHSAKHLRGGVMDDLIFQGSETRPPVALCDVELTFAVDKGRLPSPYHEMDEIRIRRRLTREGGSDGFINGKMVRIKDIIDIFLDTGISTRAYAIVEQGSISRMITAKPEERRALFEEAAGVMKYRSRRRESELKMNSTRQNLERVTDLLEEVRSQCRSLRQQSSRAERFKALQDECEQLQARSFAIRYRQLGQQMDAVRLTLAEKQKQEAEKAKHHAGTEAELARAREALVAHETEAQIKQDSLRSSEQQRATLQQQAERMAGERRLLAERKSGLAQHIEEMQQRTKTLAGEIERLKQQMEVSDDSRLQKVRQETIEKVTAAEACLTKARAKRDQQLAEFERLRSEFENQETRRQQAQSALERLEQRHQIVQRQFEEARNQLQAGETATVEANSATENAEKRAAEAAGALEEAQVQLDGCRKEREEAAGQRAESERKVRALRGESHQPAAQLAHQDVPERLREQMRSRGAIWIDESLQVPEGLEQAVAAALRGRAADVSLPANPDLSEWQELCIEAKDTPIAMFAAGLVEQDSSDESLALSIGLGTEHPLFNVFSHIHLCDSVFNSKPVSGRSLVSRDGWRLEPDGWLIPPAQNHTARRLTLQRRQRECEAELKKAEQLLQVSEKSVEKTEAALTLQQQNWQKAHLAAAESGSSLQSAQANLKRLEDDQTSLNDRIAHLTRENEEIGKDVQHWQEQRDGVSRKDQQQQLDAKEKLDAHAAEQQGCEQTLHQTRNELASADQALALHQQAVENLQKEERRIIQEIEQLTGRIDQDRAQLARTEEEIATAAAREGLDKELRTASEAVEAAHQSLNSIRQKGHELQQEAHACERSEREARINHQQSNEARQKIEIQLATEQARIQDLEEEIRQRFRKAAQELLGSLDESVNDKDAEQVVQRARELEERLSRFGPVNLLAIDEFQQASERELFLSEQSDDLESSLKTLADTISRIDHTMRQRFIDVFNETNRIFKETFPRLFGGGRAELRLDSEDVLTAGVSVIAQPPGKHLGDVGLLSGGEKALTAVALVFSIFQIKPAPFCILDEVDAPLDDANVGRYNDMLKELADRVQFLAISHNKITMQKADRLIGVSMPEAGVSRIVAVDMEQIS
ncbi:MAG: chromosome segregation protein SMC [Mariprofundaceae bacterium]|nr:chromosome segregation protein SMC [Mariprofundaceae bacterium]